MKKKYKKIDRRDFLKKAGAVGLGSVLASTRAIADPNKPGEQTKQPKTEYPQVPKRKLGKTGVAVPVLSLGANRLNNQVILRNALRWGVTYWDTAHSYVGGNSELTIGKLLSKNPQLRKNLFIVSKATNTRREPTPQAMVKKARERLQTSLERMNTNYIDLYYGVHGLDDPGQLNDKLRQWAEDAKKKGLIRFFGFSVHKNIARCLEAATKLGWIDAIMTSYNFRLMQNSEIQAAIESCHKAGIGLIAMKTVALDLQERRRLEAGEQIETEDDKKLLSHFLQRGFTPEQAKIKVVLQDERFASACVGMKTVANLITNVSAVLDKTKLTHKDMDIFAQYAKATCSGYCAGCADICESALPEVPYVSDIMRYLMYYNSYGDKDKARELFAQIPGNVRSKLLSVDYSLAEARCPQRIPIGKLVTEAASKLA